MPIIIIIIIIIIQEKINVAFSPKWTSRTRYSVNNINICYFGTYSSTYITNMTEKNQTSLQVCYNQESWLLIIVL